MIHFDLPKEQSSIIKVIGVGGGGSNAVNHMFAQHIEGVNFIICITNDKVYAFDVLRKHVVYCVASATTNAYYFDDGRLFLRQIKMYHNWLVYRRDHFTTCAMG